MSRLFTPIYIMYIRYDVMMQPTRHAALIITSCCIFMWYIRRSRATDVMRYTRVSHTTDLTRCKSWHESCRTCDHIMSYVYVVYTSKACHRYNEMYTSQSRHGCDEMNSSNSVHRYNEIHMNKSCHGHNESCRTYYHIMSCVYVINTDTPCCRYNEMDTSQSRYGYDEIYINKLIRRYNKIYTNTACHR